MHVDDIENLGCVISKRFLYERCEDVDLASQDVGCLLIDQLALEFDRSILSMSYLSDAPLTLVELEFVVLHS